MKRIIAFSMSALLIASVAAADSTPPAPIHVTEDMLLQHVLNSDDDVLIELNNVQKAKHSVELARTNLLPSISIGPIIGSTVGGTFGPSFILSSVTALLPFLVPSNWFALKESAEMFESEKLSYLIVELNEYASTEALAETIKGDYLQRAVLNDQYQALAQIQQVMEEESSALGTIAPEDLKLAQSQTQMSLASRSKMDEMIGLEVAAIQDPLGLPTDAQLIFDQPDLDTIPQESQTVDDVSKQAYGLAPERAQINDMIAADKAGKWGGLFGFFGGASLTAQSFPGSGGQYTNVSFADLTAKGSMNFGPSMIPEYALANDNITQLLLQQKQLEGDTSRTIEGTLNEIAQATQQLTLTSSAESEIKDVYAIKKEKFDLGMISLTTLLQTQSYVTTASSARVQAQVDLNTLRISLRRALLVGEFSKIQGCALQSQPKGPKGNPVINWIERLFGKGSPSNIDVNKACRTAS